jgi:hypothetical protein
MAAGNGPFRAFSASWTPLVIRIGYTRGLSGCAILARLPERWTLRACRYRPHPAHLVSTSVAKGRGL